MTKPLLVVLTVGLLAATATAARADHTAYRGGCDYHVVADTSTGGQLGGENQWNGELHALVVATDAAGVPQPYPITAECELFVNGNSWGAVASASGTGTVMGGGQFSFMAEDGDLVTMCANVTVDGDTHVDCADATDLSMLTALAASVGPGLAGLNTSSVTLAGPFVSAGFLGQFVDDLAGRRAPSDPRVTTDCTFRLHHPTGVLTVIGKTKAIGHPFATSTTIRCKIKTDTGAVLFDESKSADDDTVTMESVASGATAWGRVWVCNSGGAMWPDGRTKFYAEQCV